jgi:hypothetical protein
MTIRALVYGPTGSGGSVSGNMQHEFTVVFIGPEIPAWNGNSSLFFMRSCSMEQLGTETLAQMATKVTDCALAALVESTGLTMVRTDVWIPSYQKGI